MAKTTIDLVIDGVIVPSEPTDAMLWAGYRADHGIERSYEDFMSLCPGWREDQRTIWRAMVEEAGRSGKPKSSLPISPQV